MKDYRELTKEELIEKITELEILIEVLRKDNDQEELIHVPCGRNLGKWTWHIKNDIMICHSSKMTELNYRLDELPKDIGLKFFTEKIHPEDYLKVKSLMQDHLSGKIPLLEIEYRIQTKKGDWIWFYDNGKIIKRDENGSPLIMSGISFNITEQKRIESLLEEQNNQLMELINQDHLTNVLNKKALKEKLASEIVKADRLNKKLCLLILDIDKFKHINDHYGHVTGDQVISQVAQIIQSNIRKTDIVGRYGGEEFLVIFPNCHINKSLRLADHIRLSVEKHEFLKGIKITISGGLAEHRNESVDEFIDVADQCLYQAKNNGRNQIYSCPIEHTNNKEYYIE